MGFWKWLGRLSDEGHASETRAAKWHIAHAAVYCGLIFGYLCMSFWHVAAARRHIAAAKAKEHLDAKRADQ